MSDPRLRILVVGGGLAGWGFAVSLQAHLTGAASIAVIDCGEPGETPFAGAPALRRHLIDLGFDPLRVAERCRGAVRYGERFEVEGRGEGTLAFGTIGAPAGPVRFHDQLARLAASGVEPDAYADYALARHAALSDREPVDAPASDFLSTLDYGLTLEAEPYRDLMRETAVLRGVDRIDARPRRFARDEAGRVTALECDDGRRIEADLFVQTGEAEAMALETGWESWSGDGAGGPVRVAGSSARNLRTRLGRTAITANGFTRMLELRDTVVRLAFRPGASEGAPRIGRAPAPWTANVLRIGPAALRTNGLDGWAETEPLAAAAGVSRLLSGGCANEAAAREYNRLFVAQTDAVRDWCALPFKAAGAELEESPASRRLDDLLALFAARGRVARREHDPFGDAMWVGMLLALGYRQHGYDPQADALPLDALAARVRRIGELARAGAAQLPAHEGQP